MTHSENALFDMAARLFGDAVDAKALASAESGQWPGALWTAVQSAELPGALIPEGVGGHGASATEALSVLRAAGEHALPLPLAETMLGAWLLGQAGLAVPAGPLSVASVDHDLQLVRVGGRWQLSGTVRHAPWGRHVASIVAVVKLDGQDHVALIPTDGAQRELGHNMAREPRDTLTLNVGLDIDCVAPSDLSNQDLRAMGAAMRAQQIAGASNRITEMTVRYAKERVQFGRPIGKLQAIQQNLAILATQSAAANAAADLAAEAVSEDGIEHLAVACAKVRCSEAASLAVPIAHQIHGAFGFTYEHSLHFFTKRLLAWRDEFGREAEWNLLIGRAAIAGGADRLWAGLTAIGTSRS